MQNCNSVSTIIMLSIKAKIDTKQRFLVKMKTNNNNNMKLGKTKKLKNRNNLGN